MPEGAEGKAQLTAREPMTVAGLGMIAIALDAYGDGCRFTRLVPDGAEVEAGSVLGLLEGSSAALLQAERVLLNFIQHLSGIATETQRYVTALGSSTTALLDTRKTLPGYRVLQKYAFACGGGYNHRIGLFDRVMLKDNHLAVAGATGGSRRRLIRWHWPRPPAPTCRSRSKWTGSIRSNPYWRPARISFYSTIFRSRSCARRWQQLTGVPAPKPAAGSKSKHCHSSPNWGSTSFPPAHRYIKPLEGHRPGLAVSCNG